MGLDSLIKPVMFSRTYIIPHLIEILLQENTFSFFVEQTRQSLQEGIKSERAHGSFCPLLSAR